MAGKSPKRNESAPPPSPRQGALVKRVCPDHPWTGTRCLDTRRAIKHARMRTASRPRLLASSFYQSSPTSTSHRLLHFRTQPELHVSEIERFGDLLLGHTQHGRDLVEVQLLVVEERQQGTVGFGKPLEVVHHQGVRLGRRRNGQLPRVHHS